MERKVLRSAAFPPRDVKSERLIYQEGNGAAEDNFHLGHKQ